VVDGAVERELERLGAAGEQRAEQPPLHGHAHPAAVPQERGAAANHGAGGGAGRGLERDAVWIQGYLLGGGRSGGGGGGGVPQHGAALPLEEEREA